MALRALALAQLLLLACWLAPGSTGAAFAGKDGHLRRLSKEDDISPKKQAKLDKKLIKLAGRPPDNTTEAAVRSLLSKGADPDACCADTFGDTALHQTAENDNYIAAEVLLAEGANVEPRDAFGNTPLHDAARFNSKGVAQALIEAGADVDAVDDSQWTPLHWAASFGSVEVAQMLVEAGADRAAVNANGNTAAVEICADCKGKGELEALLL